MVYTAIFSTAYTQNKWKYSNEHCYQTWRTRGAHRVLKITLGAEKLASEWEIRKPGRARPDNNGGRHSRIVCRQIDLYVENTAFVHAAFWPWYHALPDMQISLGGLKRYTTEILLFQIGNFTIETFQSHLRPDGKGDIILGSISERVCMGTTHDRRRCSSRHFARGQKEQVSSTKLKPKHHF